MTCLDETVPIVFEEDLAWESEADGPSPAVSLMLRTLMWKTCSSWIYTWERSPFHLKQSTGDTAFIHIFPSVEKTGRIFNMYMN